MEVYVLFEYSSWYLLFGFGEPGIRINEVLREQKYTTTFIILLIDRFTSTQEMSKCEGKMEDRSLLAGYLGIRPCPSVAARRCGVR